MRSTNFAVCLTKYLRSYLPGQVGLSENTIEAYRDTFKRVLIFAEKVRGIHPDRITLEDINLSFVEDFLTWLEKECHNSIATRNQRLSAIKAFAKYARSCYPEYLLDSQRINDIRAKRHKKPEMNHLTPDDVQLIFSQIPTDSIFNRRDVALLTLLYDSGARVQEICDLRVQDVRLKKPYTVRLTGKGQKTRCVPIMQSTVDILILYIRENELHGAEKATHPLFFNHQQAAFTRAGVSYVLKKYYDKARALNPGLPPKISPHVLRHSKAMHLLQAGVELVYIRDMLGHTHVETTEVYAKTDTELRRKKLEKVQISIEKDLPDWTEDKGLMALLHSL